MDINDIIKPENKVYGKSSVLTDNIMHYCPGCSHGVVHKLVAQVIEEMDIQDKTIGVSPVGCSVFAYNYLDIDWQEAAHGRAPALATAIKRLNPDKYVFTYQGDGDLASIGAAEITHAATRGENITVIFVNNAIYGMTGGQMAPTTLPGQVTTTSPYGRDPKLCGYPIRVSEMLATLDGPAYIARVSVHDVKHIMDAKKCIKKAFETQIAGKGFSMIEVLSACPTNWGMTPQEALKWLEANMIPQYPLGVKKEVE
jgi:2-oxoglutarate ferredoxin oxidoreductase subunit beta